MYCFLALPDGDKYQYDVDKGLRIHALSHEDNGTYECRAEVESQGNLKVRILTLDVLCELLVCVTRECIPFVRFKISRNLCESR